MIIKIDRRSGAINDNHEAKVGENESVILAIPLFHCQFLAKIKIEGQLETKNAYRMNGRSHKKSL